MTRGLHHVTAIASNERRNRDFYANVLGLRLVKHTMNYDFLTPHLYYGDAVGTPGSLLTFFIWPEANPGQQGSGQIIRIGLDVPRSSFAYWVERLITFGVKFEGPSKQKSRSSTQLVLGLRDPDGLLLELRSIDTEDAARLAISSSWRSPVPAECAIRRICAAEGWMFDSSPLARKLETTLQFQTVAGEGSITSLRTGAERAAVLHLRSVGDFPSGTQGPGTVDHVAFRVSDGEELQRVRDALDSAGMEPTPIINRFYFQSVYFRDESGILFECATDGPGFLIDSPRNCLGRNLCSRVTAVASRH